VRLLRESFFSFASTVRLSDLLRFMLCCEDALMLCDADNCVVHANAAWSALTGFSISEIEGMPIGFLHGPSTDLEEVSRCEELTRSGLPAEMSGVSYHKDHSEFRHHVMMVPLRGGFSSFEITHYLSLFNKEEAPQVLTVKTVSHKKKRSFDHQQQQQRVSIAGSSSSWCTDRGDEDDGGGGARQLT
jgi:PAS domain S-box-containing protein